MAVSITKKIAISTTGYSTWTVPTDWVNSNNKIEVIGAGGNGFAAASGSGSGGGGGGAYAASANISLTPSATVFLYIGTATGVIDKWLTNIGC